MAETIARRLEACGNRPSGFDYMRLVLATSVVAIHSGVAMGNAPGDTPGGHLVRPALAVVLGMFFTLSGFLVAGSLERCRTMVSFLGLRGLRLVPALAVDTTISALILGPLFTTLPLADYFADRQFHVYFLNIVGDVHFDLPGVFATHPTPSVNHQLWTLPFELYCYVLLTILAVMSAVRFRLVFAGVTLLATAAFAVADLRTPAHMHMLLSGWALVLCFLLGVTGYLFRDRIVLSGWACAAAAVVTYAVLYDQRGDTLALIPLAYVTVFLGLRTPPRHRVVSAGDYSYGIFLYGYPVQQAAYYLSGGNGWLNFLIAYPIVVALAVFSWFWVEKPALRLRPRLMALEAAIVRWSGAVPLSHWVLQAPVGPWLRRPPARERA